MGGRGVRTLGSLNSSYSPFLAVNGTPQLEQDSPSTSNLPSLLLLLSFISAQELPPLLRKTSRLSWLSGQPAPFHRPQWCGSQLQPQHQQGHTTCSRTLLTCNNNHHAWGNRTPWREYSSWQWILGKWPVTKDIPMFQRANYSVLGYM